MSDQYCVVKYIKFYVMLQVKYWAIYYEITES